MTRSRNSSPISNRMRTSKIFHFLITGGGSVKWYKHLVDSGDDPDIDSAVILFGSDGYYVFFRTLEIMAREFDIESPGKNIFLWEFLRKKYRISGRKLTKILSFFHQKNRIFFRVFKDGKNDMVELNCPKLKSLSDEYTQKKLSKMSGQSRDSIGNENRTDNRQQITDNRLTMLLTDPEGVGFLNLGGEYLKQIVEKGKKIDKLQDGSQGDKRINIWAWINQSVNNGGHPKAIDYSLDHLIKRWKGVGQSWPYIQAIFQMQNGNFWEQDHIAEAEIFKAEWEQLDDRLKGLVGQIGSGGKEKNDNHNTG